MRTLSTFLALLLLLAGCAPNEAAGQAPAAAPPPATVEVAVAERRSVNVSQEMVAELKAVETADIRARVQGTLLSHSFKEGSQVRQGQVLFQLDPRPFEAALSNARAQLSQAEGRLGQARASLTQRQATLQRARNQANEQQVSAELEEAKANLDAASREVDRYRSLVDQGAVPRQRYDQVVDQQEVARSRYESVKARLRTTVVRDTADVGEASAAVEAAEADVVSAQASVEAAAAAVRSAELNLSYATITAPFSGVIGTLGVDPGSLVQPGETRLATLSKNDPIHVDFQISETEYLTLAQGSGFEQAPYRLVLADGSVYPHEGTFVLVDRNVNEATGTITVRASFPNPGQVLKPGGFGRVTMQTQTLAGAVVIPQEAVTSLQSLDTVYVVKDDQTVEQRKITLGPRVDREVVVQDGLQAGERVVVQGLQKIRPGAPVQIAGEVS